MEVFKARDINWLVASAFRSEEGIWLVQRALPPFDGSLGMLEGPIFQGELAEETLRRVYKSGLNIDVRVGRLIDIIQHPPKEDIPHINTLVYQTTYLSGEMRLGVTISRAQFFKHVPENLYPLHQDFLRLHWDEL